MVAARLARLPCERDPSPWEAGAGGPGLPLPHTALRGGDAIMGARPPAVGHAGRCRERLLAWGWM